MQKNSSAASGVVYAVICFSLWGLFPIYWKQLLAVPSEVVLAHRIIWGAFFMLAVLLLMRQFKGMMAVFRSPTTIVYTLLAAFLIGINWWLNIYAAQSNRIAEASMGYYMTPLLSVIVGLVFFKERLRPLQWLAIASAGAGVSYMVFRHAQIPTLALALAGSFAIYGAIKKQVNYSASIGIAMESWMILLPALIYLLFVQEGMNLTTGYTTKEFVMLALCGPLTLLPLLFFAGAVKRISLTVLGITQYVAPTLSFLIAVVIYHEPLDQGRLPAFIGVWLGVVLFTAESAWLNHRRLSALKKAS